MQGNNDIKKCIKCKAEKTIDMFSKGRNECKSCRLDLDYTDETLDPTVATKVCFGRGGCGKTFTLDHFTLMKVGQFGRSNLCIDCRKIARRKNTNENPSYDGKKICNGNLCKGKELDKKEFNKDKFTIDGLQSVCSICQLNKTAITQSKLDSFVMKILNDARERVKKHESKDRHLEFDIDKDFILNLYEQQGEKCAITKKEMTHNSLNCRKDGDCHILNPYNISIDRIDNTKGYTKTNVRLVCAFVNRIRMDMNDDDFFELCKEVATERKGKKVDIDEVLESYNFDEFLDYKLTNAKFNAKQRDLEFDLEKEDLIEIYKNQRGKCIFTKTRLTFDKKSKKNSDLSIDRIDSSKGYTRTNIQLVENRVNVSKSDISNDDYTEYCKSVSKNL